MIALKANELNKNVKPKRKRLCGSIQNKFATATTNGEENWKIAISNLGTINEAGAVTMNDAGTVTINNAGAVTMNDSENKSTRKKTRTS